MPQKVFLSYSRSDEVFVRKLARALSDAGLDVWLDVDDIPPGVNWSSAIQQGLDTCEALVLVLTPDSMASPNVANEWQYFIDEKKPIYPVLWKPVEHLHFQLRRIQWIDFSRQSYDAALARLLAQLTAPDTPREPTAALVERFFAARNAGDWLHARDLLEQIIRRADVPAFFALDVYEDEVYGHVERLEFDLETADKRQQWETDAASAYAVIRALAAHERREAVWEALQRFWEDYEGYDPENIAARVRPLPPAGVLKLYAQGDVSRALRAAARKLGFRLTITRTPKGARLMVLDPAGISPEQAEALRLTGLPLYELPDGADAETLLLRIADDLVRTRRSPGGGSSSAS